MTRPVPASPSQEGGRHGGAAWWLLAGILAVIAATNVLLNRVLPDWAYVPVFVLAAVGAVALARRGGVSAADLGLAPGPWRRSALAGLLLGSIAAGVIFAGLAVPAVRAVYLDQRAAGLGMGALLFQVLVRIPLGTALGEELLFRSAVLGTGMHLGSRTVAVGLSSVLFGLWHILPTLSVQQGNAALETRPTVLIVAAGIALTALAGAGLAWLRLRTRHIAGPMVLHACLNMSALVAAFLATAR